jgi:MoaA/NifB/PqqE/SkfB family radical SAM enzyme
MDFGLFEKLIREVALYKDQVKRLHLHNYGEPLLDKKLPDKIKLAKQLGIHHTYLVTNGSLLTPALSRQLIEAGLDEFKVSFYGTDAETYNKTMRGLDFDRTLQNLRDFFALRKKLGKQTPRIIIQYLPQASNKERTDDFFRLMKPLIDESVGDTLNVFTMHNYGGGMSTDPVPADPRSICNYPWRTMVILQDGKVALCCMDYNGVQTVGDAAKNTIKEIWTGESFRKARSNFKQLNYADYPACSKCDLIR